ncbi:transposase [Elysia marginata]|uniref:Transposase n=1 Tax=Elysia marginata TaxID=1093978 RepID=A0AAV4FF83_9GAST|nr:transposase [Elysia marginata]
MCAKLHLRIPSFQLKIWRWTRSSREENPSESTVHDQARTSGPLSASDFKHQSRVDQLIRENRRVKQIDISIEIGISQERVHHIITNHLGYRKVSARWGPRMLTPQMKLQRVQICRELLAKFDEDGEDFLRQVVTGDESWVHHFDPESKQQSKEYRDKTSPSPKKFKVFSSARKVLLTIFWDSEGVVHTEILEQGNPVNSTKYVNTLEKLKARLRRVRIEKVSITYHDNARPHTSLETRTALDSLGLRTLPHPPYGRDLAPSDFFLFPKLKGNRYETDEDVKNAVLSWCRDKTAVFFADSIQQVVRRWRLCIERDGDYVEK